MCLTIFDSVRFVEEIRLGLVLQRNIAGGRGHLRPVQLPQLDESVFNRSRLMLVERGADLAHPLRDVLDGGELELRDVDSHGGDNYSIRITTVAFAGDEQPVY